MGLVWPKMNAGGFVTVGTVVVVPVNVWVEFVALLVANGSACGDAGGSEVRGLLCRGGGA